MSERDELVTWLQVEAAPIMRAVWEEWHDHGLDAPDFLATVLANHWSQRKQRPPINEAARGGGGLDAPGDHDPEADAILRHIARGGGG